MLRQLREIAMPLAAVEAAFDAGADEAARLLDEHVAKILRYTSDDQNRWEGAQDARQWRVRSGPWRRATPGAARSEGLSLPSTLSAGRSPGCGNQRQPTGRPG
ncbi:hypothetical protein GCM10010228_58460 [Streptomyces massasporeus]|nr:hypothetical protein GCM10010228_58460 [Streptomyces massasporeus]